MSKNTITKFLNDQGELMFRMRKTILELVIAGMPFLFIGFYFMYYFVYALVEYIRFLPPLSDWLALLPGLVFMFIVMVFFLFIGFYMCSTEVIRVNRELKVIDKRRQIYRLSLKVYRFEFSDIELMKCYQKSFTHYASEPGEGETHYIIDLYTKDNKEIKLIEFASKKQARSMATEIAKFSEIPFKNSL